MQGNPDFRRVAAERLAEETRGSHSHHREGMALHDERGPHDRRVAAVDCLPGVVAEDGNRSSRAAIIGGREHPPAEGTNAERREVIAGDELRPEWSGGVFATLTPHARARATRLEGRHLFELGGRGLQPLVQREGKHAPAFLRATLDAAVVAVAHAVEPCRVGDRQRAQHNRVDEREDGRRPADAQGQREHGC